MLFPRDVWWFVAVATVKGFHTARGARTDPYRAANFILRSALEGKQLIYLLPPEFVLKKSESAGHSVAQSSVHSWSSSLSIY